MLTSIAIGIASALLVCVLLALRWLLRIVREALEEIAREEVKQELKAAIPKLSLGLARRAAKDVPVREASIVQDWEARLKDESARPLKMLALAIQLYRNRLSLAAELSEPLAELSTSRTERSVQTPPRIGPRLSRFARLSVAVAARGRSVLSKVEMRRPEWASPGAAIRVGTVGAAVGVFVAAYELLDPILFLVSVFAICIFIAWSVAVDF
jgi:hypothetical protein